MRRFSGGELMLYGLSWADWATLLLYVALTVWAGVAATRKVKDTIDFFMGGRRFGKAFLIFFAFGAGTSGNDAVGVSSKTFTTGLSGIWYQWLWLFCTPFYWLIAPVLRRMRCLTMGDYFEYRFSGSVSALYTVVGVLQLTLNIGVIQLGAGSMIEGITGGEISRNAAIIGMTVLMLAYGVAGGLAAAVVTDFLQGILTVVLSFLLLPFALNAVGGFSGLHDVIEREYPDQSMFSLSTPGEINLFWIGMLGLNSLIGIVTQPHIIGVCAAGKTEMDGRVGFAGGNLIKRVCTVAWTIVGLCAIVMYLGQDIHPDSVFGQAAKDLLPGVAPGLVGLFLAALIASVVSSTNAFMVSSSGLFTQNFYRRWLVREREDKHYVWVGRVSGLVIVIIGVWFSFQFTSVPDGLVMFFKLQAMMGPAFWIGLFWRRATAAGAWAATLAAFGILVATSTDGFHAWAAATLPEYMIWNDKFRDSWQIFFYLLGGFGVGIVVSLVTPRVNAERLNRVFRCIRTPVNEIEEHQPEPFMLPPGMPAFEPRKVINHPDFEIYWPSRIAVTGFTVVWIAVALMIGLFLWMASWGA
jgi:SSS family transporter